MLSETFGRGARNIANTPLEMPDFSIFKASPDAYGSDPDSLTTLEKISRYLLNVLPRITDKMFGEAPDPFTPNWKPHADKLEETILDGAASGIVGAGVFGVRTAQGFSDLFTRLSKSGALNTPGINAPVLNDSWGYGGGYSEPASPAARGAPGAIVTWGDSQANGMGRYVPGAINLGRVSAGFTVEKKPIDYHGKIPSGAAVLMKLGGNDMAGFIGKGDEAIEAYADRLVGMAAEIRAGGGVPILIGMQRPMDASGNVAPYTGNREAWEKPGFLDGYLERMTRFNEILEQKATQQGITFSRTEGRIPAEMRADDHLHYRKQGYELMARNALMDAGMDMSGPLAANSGKKNDWTDSLLGGAFGGAAALPSKKPAPSLGLGEVTALSGADMRSNRSFREQADAILARERGSWKGHPASALGKKFEVDGVLTGEDGRAYKVTAVVQRHHHPSGFKGRDWGDGFAKDGVTPDPNKANGWHNGISLIKTPLAPAPSQQAPEGLNR